ncbi:iron-containing alcohol dehydrogenase [Qaidamihabitans albus]|uniref:iron-containing alcohol dehydrogenase n=1 Tax=Qaidamihabitans albus TaxID=2795733 RepID=UPI0018F133A0|nr:iron-containing alcohol dehydrogenase [Qaidamihabitans albus]
MNGTSLIQYLNRVWFGDGARARIATELAQGPVRRPLLLSDRGLEESGLLALVRPHVPGVVAEYLDIPANPTEKAVRAAAEQYRQRDCDGIVAVGGGSVLDCAKAVAVAVSHPGPLEVYSVETPDARPITTAIAPVVAVPTTAGTGSEVGRGAAITLDSGRKAVFLSSCLVPRAAVCDPELTHSLPPGLTAGTGIDAFSHALEAYTSPAVNPPADAIALDAMERLRIHLPRAVANGSDAQARWQVMMGALEAAMTTWKGLGTAHALSMPLDRFDVHHGTAIGLLLPHTIGLALTALGKDRRDRLARALGCEPAQDALVRVVSDLVEPLGLPRSLSDFGVTADDFGAIADEAAGTTFHRSAPVSLGRADYIHILQRAAPGLGQAGARD